MLLHAFHVFAVLFVRVRECLTILHVSHIFVFLPHRGELCHIFYENKFYFEVFFYSWLIESKIADKLTSVATLIYCIYLILNFRKI